MPTTADLQHQQALQSIQAMQAVASEVAHLRRTQEDDKGNNAGQLGALRGQNRFLVYLARGCDEFDVSLCAGQLGRELYEDLRKAGNIGRTLMQQIGFPEVMSNRLAYGLASACWGGRDADHGEDHALMARDFPKVSEEGFDAWIAPMDHKREKRFGAITSASVWRNMTDNQIKVFGLTYGREHTSERTKCRNEMYAWHEAKPHIYPFKWLANTWEELWFQWWEELKLVLRDLTREMQTESPSIADIRFYALAPNASGTTRLQMPNTFQLDDPDGYYMFVVAPREARRVERSFYNIIVNKQGPKKSGGEITTDENADDEFRSGEVAKPRPGGKAKAKSAAAKSATTTAAASEYPAGKRLGKHELIRALKKAPMDGSGKKRLCWDASCHSGCKKSAADCAHSHQQITNIKTLDWATQAEIIRRGGLRNGRKGAVSEIDTRIDQLRINAKAEAQSKKNESGKAAGTVAAGTVL